LHKHCKEFCFAENLTSSSHPVSPDKLLEISKSIGPIILKFTKITLLYLLKVFNFSFISVTMHKKAAG
jgi:hypothetical protein